MAMPTGATLRQQQQQQQHHQDQQQGSGSNGLAGTSTKERLLTQGDQLGTFLLADKFSNSSSFNQHRQQQKQRQDPPQLHPEGKHFDSRGGGGIGDGSSAGGGAGAGGALFNNANVAMNTTRARPSMRGGVQGQGGFQNDTLGPGLGASSGPGNGGSAVMGYERSGSAGSTEGSNVHGGNGGPNRTVRTAQTFRRPSLESSDGGHAGRFPSTKNGGGASLSSATARIGNSTLLSQFHADGKVKPSDLQHRSSGNGHGGGAHSQSGEATENSSSSQQQPVKQQQQQGKSASASSSSSSSSSSKHSGSNGNNKGGGGSSGSSGSGSGGPQSNGQLVLRQGDPAVPADGIFFAQYKGRLDSLVVYRSAAERASNPERLNLDRRHLTCCPILKHEDRVRLLNYQNNYITRIDHLQNLPNLIFLDLYNNSIEGVSTALAAVPTLRVLMLGKNRIRTIQNLEPLTKLDVLDLHSNVINKVENLSALSELRVLNLAGNQIKCVENISGLQSLTELNVRRNHIEHAFELDRLPGLQRIFMSNNSIREFEDISSIFNVK